MEDVGQKAIGQMCTVIAERKDQRLNRSINLEKQPSVRYTIVPWNMKIPKLSHIILHKCINTSIFSREIHEDTLTFISHRCKNRFASSNDENIYENICEMIRVNPRN
jgi:hypothetical protein